MKTDHPEAIKRFEHAKSAWSDARHEWITDARFVSGNPDDQWDPTIRAGRDNDDVPVLTFDRCHPIVQQIVNRARQERPQPKILPGDDGQEQTADMLEGKLRQLQYASQADLAYDMAVGHAAIGGIGWYRINREFVHSSGKGAKMYYQEPRIRRILDPLSQYPDPNAIEADFSDGEYHFSREWVSRDAFERRYNEKPIDFDKGSNEDWVKEDQVCIAEYWWFEHTTKARITYFDPELGELEDWEETLFPDGLTEAHWQNISNRREMEVRVLHRAVIDGEKVLEEEIWPGEWIPIIPVLGQEMVVEGKRNFISAIRYQRSPQKLINAAASAMAEELGTKERATWKGYKGQFKDQKWRDGKRHKYQESEIVTLPGGSVAPLPELVTYEPPINALSQAMMIATDAIKGGFGYVDNTIKSSQNEISGVAIQRRAAQQDLTNFHFEDNLVHSQWHCCRVVLDLFLKLTDTSRPVRTRKDDGTAGVEPVSVPTQDGSVPLVPGMENVPHHDIHGGSYEIEITTGPGYAARREEELDWLMQLVGANPNLFPLYADRIFALMGYEDLRERAEMLLPPQIQQAMQAKEQGATPREIALQNQLGQLQGFLQQVMQKLQTKQVEADNKLNLHKLDTIKDITVEGMKQRHEHAENMTSHAMTAIAQALAMFHESELPHDQPTPQPGAQPTGAPTQ